MLAEADIELVREAIKELEAQDRPEHAAAVKATLAVALAAEGEAARSEAGSGKANDDLPTPREWVFSGLPEDKIARLEALHERMEAGEPLSRAEIDEMDRLAIAVNSAATARLEEWCEMADRRRAR